MPYPLERIENLARRLGIGFLAAARLCGRKGSRRRRERQCACLGESPEQRHQRIMAQRWDLRESA